MKREKVKKEKTETKGNENGKKKAFKIGKIVLVTIIGIAMLAVLAAVLPYWFLREDVQFREGITDDFSSLTLRSDNENAYWWIFNYGDKEQVADFCGDASCILLYEEIGTDFTRFELYPDETPGYYTNAELADVYSGYSYDAPGIWEPDVAKPVVLKARVRWSREFKPDGTGGAVGTSGICLWNSPTDWENQKMKPADAMCFMWAMRGTPMMEGLSAYISHYSIPHHIYHVEDSLNMQEWVDVEMRWEQVNNMGLQRVSFFVNDEEIGSKTLYLPFEALSLELWHDNQLYSFLGEAEYKNPDDLQYFDIDYISVTRDK